MLRSEEHLIEYNSDRPNIGLAVIVSSPENFGSHVERRSQHGLSELLVGEQFGETEIGDLDLSVVHEYVGQFEVSMHDLMLVECFEGIEDLEEKLDGFFLGESFILLEILGEVALVAVLKNEVEIVGGLLDVVELDDVSVIAGLEDLDLVLEELQKLALILHALPLMFSRLIALIAISPLSVLL